VCGHGVGCARGRVFWARLAAYEVAGLRTSKEHRVSEVHRRKAWGLLDVDARGRAAHLLDAVADRLARRTRQARGGVS